MGAGSPPPLTPAAVQLRSTGLLALLPLQMFLSDLLRLLLGSLNIGCGPPLLSAFPKPLSMTILPNQTLPFESQLPADSTICSDLVYPN